MTHIIKRILLSAIALLTLTAPLAVPAMVNAAACDANDGTADLQNCLNNGTCLSTDGSSCPTTSADDSVNNIIATVINIFSLVVGVVAVIMIIVGGLKYITSSGDSSNITGAKNTILYAIIGLVIVALAQVIVRFVLGRASPS